ncbi:MAG: ferric reductase-like transmembrane domain-containing protein [Desulfatiglandaceae bacterium]
MKKSLLVTLMAFCVGLAVLFWSRMVVGGLPWPAYLYDAGRLLALTGFVLITFQYVLSSRIQWIEKGIGLDNLFVIHRGCGAFGVLLLTAHPLLLLLSERLQGYATPLGFLKILGLVTLLLLWVTAGAVLIYGRIRIPYEAWKAVHRAGYAILPLAFFHSFLIGSTLQRGSMRALWVILVLIYLSVLAEKIRRRYALRRHPFTVAAVTQETHDTWGLHFEGGHRDYAPGQFMFLQLKRKDNVSKSHPFTIASSPARKGLSICAKAVGDFTSTLGKTQPSDLAYIDMPFGVFSFLQHDAKRLVFIAGGIGITPFMSMLRYIRDRKLKKELILFWANKMEKDIAFRDELEKMAAEMPSLKVIHVLSREENWPGEKGRIHADTLKRHVGDFETGEFFVCGPPPMMSDIQKILSDLGVSKKRIHMERFALR